MLAALSRVLQVERQPSRVLLVEDDADLAKVILATFERAGIQVHHASTQRKAMELCVSSPPDLLILDIALPDGDGFGLVDWLRQQQEMKQLPLVVYSAQDLNEGERNKLRLGPTEFLTKARVSRRMWRRWCSPCCGCRMGPARYHWDGMEAPLPIFSIAGRPSYFFL